MNENSMFSKVISRVVISAILMCILIPIGASAYNTDPSWANGPDASYGVSAAASNKFGYYFIDSAIKTWNYSSSPLSLSCTGSPYITDVMIYYSDNDSGSYGTTSSKGTKITFYAGMDDLSTTRKKETIVHEVGHTLGLDHTQESNNSKAVMRALGFNDKAYPLQDDKDGIDSLY